MLKLQLIIFIIVLNLSNNFTAYGNDPPLMQGMVATAHPLASQVGEEILKQDGNAVDAAVAVMFALSVVEPWASGLGGGGFMLLMMKNNPNPIIIDYRERAPMGALPHLFYRDELTFRYYAYTGYRSICVPGMPAGAQLALKQYGTMSIEKVLEPVIRLARDGFTVSAKFNKMLSQYYDIVETNRATSLIFLPDWLPLQEGDLMQREDLASTMETLASNGIQNFYKGEIAKELVADIESCNGLLTQNDLNSYKPIVRKPIVGTYRDYEIVTVPPPGSGGLALIQLLNILEEFNLKKLGYNSGDYIHVFTEALKYVLNDREKYNGDPDFSNISVDQYLAKQYGSTIKAKIDTQQAQFVGINDASLKYESDNGSHISIIDCERNAIAVTQSLNFYFGSGITNPKHGILFNNGLFHFSQDSLNINAIAPTKRSASSMAPTLILKRGSPFLILGSSGASRIITTLAHIIVGVVDFNMNINQAISAPRFHYEKGEIQLETRIYSDAIDRLKKLGHKVKLKTDYHTYFGIAQGILVDQINGELHGAGDPRGEGEAIGY